MNSRRFTLCALARTSRHAQDISLQSMRSKRICCSAVGAHNRGLERVKVGHPHHHSSKDRPGRGHASFDACTHRQGETPGGASILLGAVRGRWGRSLIIRRFSDMRRSKTQLYSMTSLARTSSAGGIVSPSALAVLRLIVSSNFVGCSIGSSAGLAPCKIRCTYQALRLNSSDKVAP
jgi:hypothetical protein